MHGELTSLHTRQDLPTRNPNQSCYLDPTRRSSLSSSIHQDIWQLAQHRVGEISSLALHNHKSTAEPHWTANLWVERERIKNIVLDALSITYFLHNFFDFLPTN